MTMFVTSQSFIYLMFVSAAVSEIHDLNKNKDFENDYFQFTTMYVTDPFFHESNLLTISTH